MTTTTEQTTAISTDYRPFLNAAAFYGERSSNPLDAVTRRSRGRKNHSVPLCTDIKNHSPNGFSWGYGGSGPSQLALALLVHTIGKKQALRWYMDFKWEVISKIDSHRWTIVVADIKTWVKQKDHKGVRHESS